LNVEQEAVIYMQSIMRRVILVSSLAFCLAGSPVFAGPNDSLEREQVWSLLKRGGVALLLRHGQTEPGIGDPDGFKLDDCSTQRNLSAAGRSELRGVAARVAGAKVKFARAYTSRWCRCQETARLVMGAQGGVEVWPALNSQFPGNATIPSANPQVIEKLRHMPVTESWLLVTHQVNITALTAIVPAMGEGVLVQPSADGITVIGRVKL